MNIHIQYKNGMRFHKKDKFLCIDDNIRIRLKSIDSYQLNLPDNHLYIIMKNQTRFIIRSGDLGITMDLIQILDNMLLNRKSKVE